MVDFDAKYRFRKVISCRLHDWNLDLKFAKFRVKVGPRSQNFLKKVVTATFSWITLKFNVFCWDKYYFSESLGCKLIENYDGFKNILLFFQKVVRQSKKFDIWHASKETSFSYSIFHRFLQNMHQNIRKGSYFMNLSSSGEYLIFFVFYAYVYYNSNCQFFLDSWNLSKVKKKVNLARWKFDIREMPKLGKPLYIT